jgi:phage gp46-like protein
MSDIMITENGDGGDLVIRDPLRADGLDFVTDNADFYEDLGIGTAIYVSLFDAPTWNESLKTANERVPSIGQLEIAFNDPITVGSIAKLQRIAASQLSWLPSTGVCQSIEVEVRNPEVATIEIDITATEPNDTQNSYKVLWDKQEQKLTSFVRTSDRRSNI